MPRAYLDTSAIVKRYVHEKGSEAMGLAYSMAEAGSLSLMFSIWNVGEAIGVIDAYEQRRWISPEQCTQALSNFARESLRLARIGTLETLTLSSPLLTDAWPLVRKYHLYQADAIQILAARYSQADFLLSADQRLLQVAKAAGVSGLNVEEEEAVKRILEESSNRPPSS